MRKCLWFAIFLFSSQLTLSPNISDEIRNSNNELMIHYWKDQGFHFSEFSPEIFYQAMVFVGIQNPEIVFRQVLLETGWFKSELFTKYNNPFGMKKPTKRETYCIGMALGHGSYNHWYEAIKDYKLWQDFWLKGALYNEEQYYTFLDTLSYAEDKLYIRKLKSLNLDLLSS